MERVEYAVAAELWNKNLLWGVGRDPPDPDLWHGCRKEGTTKPTPSPKKKKYINSYKP